MYQISIDESLRRIFITSKYTKTLRPTFGLDRRIDKQMSLYELRDLKADILEQIALYEPRIEVLGIAFENEQIANNKLAIKLSYKVKESAIKEMKRYEL